MRNWAVGVDERTNGSGFQANVTEILMLLHRRSQVAVIERSYLLINRLQREVYSRVTCAVCRNPVLAKSHHPMFGFQITEPFVHPGQNLPPGFPRPFGPAGRSPPELPHSATSQPPGHYRTIGCIIFIPSPTYQREEKKKVKTMLVINNDSTVD